VWFRESTNEWVLELEGSINGTGFVSRHTCPPDTAPEDVPGLRHLYTTPPASQEQADDTRSCIDARNRLNAALHGDGALIDDLETAVHLACLRIKRARALKDQHDRDSAELRRLCQARDDETKARKAAQEQLYAERERHTAEVKKLQAEVGRLKASPSQAQQPSGEAVALPDTKLDPMTRQQVREAYYELTACTLDGDTDLACLVAKAVEAHHGIKGQA
jgi:hypothetical protein